MNIVIVESPAKAKTINQYLGNAYKVISSVGHFRGLPDKGNDGVVPEEDFFMKYVVESKDKDKALTISKSVSKGDTLWIATD